jgi:Flp pilus assembly protein CpaB
VVNLLVNPEQAETLTLASNQQVKIQLVLRNPLDTKVDPVPGTALNAIFGDKTVAKPKSVVVAKSAKKPASEAFSVEVINGSSQSKQVFASPEEKP